MTVEYGFGWSLLAIGALMLWRGYRSVGAMRIDRMFVGAGQMSFGLWFLFRESGPVLKLGCLALSAGFAIAQSARRRRESPREFIVLSSTMVLAAVMVTLNELGYLENCPKGSELILLLPLAAAGLIWAVVTLFKALRAPFRPLPPIDRD